MSTLDVEEQVVAIPLAEFPTETVAKKPYRIMSGRWMPRGGGGETTRIDEVKYDPTTGELVFHAVGEVEPVMVFGPEDQTTWGVRESCKALVINSRQGTMFVFMER